MTPQRWQRIRTILEEALETTPDRRTALVANRCGGDDELRSSVSALLAAELADGGILDEDEPSGAGLADFAALDRLIGQRAGPWEIGERIGRGGMGVVFRARRADSDLVQSAALKILGRGGAPAGARFRRERDVLAALDHPHISRLLDAGQTGDGAPYIAMELIDGERIDQFCDSRAMPIESRLRLFMQVCHAVHFAHQRLIVHRDLKPANILVTRDGAPKLLDFGIAKLLGDERAPRAAATQSSAAPLTPEYASPEQVRGERITVASDVYSLGVVLYELLCGHRPFEQVAAQGFALQRAICESAVDAPSSAVTRVTARRKGGGADSSITPDTVSRARGESSARLRRRLAGDLDNIVLRAMQKEAGRRYASAEQFADDIGRYLAKLPVRARPDTFGYRTRQFVRRNATGVVAASVAILALIVGVVSVSLGMWHARAAQRVADAEARRARLESAKLDRTLDAVREMLAAAGRDQQAGADVRVRDVLTDAAGRLDRAVDGDPEVDAAVRDAIGEGFSGLGLFTDAQRQFRAALELREKAGAAEGADQVRTLARLAVAELLSDQRDRALPTAQSAARLAETAAAAPSTAQAAALRALGMVALAANDPSRAASYYRAAYDALRAVRGDESGETLDAALDLAVALWTTGDLDEAQGLAEHVLARRSAHQGPASPSATLAMIRLAQIKERQGAKAEAEQLYRAAVDRRREFWGDRHAGPAIALHHLGVFLLKEGRAADAEWPLRDALALRRKFLHPQHRLLVQSLLALSQVVDRLDKPAEANALRDEARAIQVAASLKANPAADAQDER